MIYKRIIKLNNALQKILIKDNKRKNVFLRIKIYLVKFLG